MINEMKPNIKSNVWKGKEVKNWETEFMMKEQLKLLNYQRKAEKTEKIICFTLIQYNISFHFSFQFKSLNKTTFISIYCPFLINRGTRPKIFSQQWYLIYECWEIYDHPHAWKCTLGSGWSQCVPHNNRFINHKNTKKKKKLHPNMCLKQITTHWKR